MKRNVRLRVHEQDNEDIVPQLPTLFRIQKLYFRMRLMHLQFNTFTVTILHRIMEYIHIPLHYALLCVWKDEKRFVAVASGEEVKKL